MVLSVVLLSNGIPLKPPPPTISPSSAHRLLTKDPQRNICLIPPQVYMFWLLVCVLKANEFNRTLQMTCRLKKRQQSGWSIMAPCTPLLETGDWFLLLLFISGLKLEERLPSSLPCLTYLKHEKVPFVKYKILFKLKTANRRACE